ncbi:MAG: flippase [Acidobacteriia bacterium]|nr:flippase [Terriglobia bacterium]
MSAEAAWPVNPAPPVRSPEAAGPVAAVADRPAHDGDLNKLAAGAGVALGGKIAGRGIRLLGDIAMARLLGPLGFGLYAIGWTISRIVTLITPLGLNIGVIRYGARYWKKDAARLKGVVLQSLALSFAAGAVFTAVFYFGAPWIGSRLFDKPESTPIIRWFALAFPFMTCVTVAAAATRISHRMKFGTITEDMSQPITDLMMFVTFYLIGWRLGGAVLACLLSFVIATVLGLQYVHRLFRDVVNPRVKAIYPGKELLAFSLPASLTGVFGVLLIWVDRLFVGFFRPAAEVGIYSAASQLSVTFSIILGGFAAIFSPMAADLYHHGELGRLEELYRISTKWGLYLSLPPFLVTCFAPKLIMGVLFGKAYVAGWPVLLILTFAQVINAGTGPVGYLLVMAGYQKRMFQISGSMFVVAVVLGLVLIPRYGMTGAAVATGIALSGMFILAIVLARYVLGMVPYDRRYLKGALATALAGLPLLFLRNLHIGTALITVAINTVLTCAVFGGTLILLGLDTEDRKFIQMIQARLQPALARARQEV